MDMVWEMDMVWAMVIIMGMVVICPAAEYRRWRNRIPLWMR